MLQPSIFVGQEEECDFAKFSHFLHEENQFVSCMEVISNQNNLEVWTGTSNGGIVIRNAVSY